MSGGRDVVHLFGNESAAEMLQSAAEEFPDARAVMIVVIDETVHTRWGGHDCNTGDVCYMQAVARLCLDEIL